ncbi:hypothetical protein Pfo_010760 [Paulownia fortunei]|nr:hypothetical protein Pfo_010760 [Paulownia fortunei]
MDTNPEFFQTGYYNAQFTPEKRLSDAKNGDHFIIEDLLDFPNDETMVAADGALEAAMTGTSTDSSTVTAVDTSCNSSFSAVHTAEPHFHPADIGGPRSSAGGHFSSELCVPYDDLAELEWLSNFVEESFSSEDLQKLQLIQGMKARTDEASETHHYQFQPEITRTGPMLRPEMSVPAKARSKRSRAAPGNWTSRLLVVSPAPPANVPAMSSSSDSDIATAKQAAKPALQKKKEGPESSAGGDGRKCLHCATDKTPQWRTGPMGPKTLCNACGVRYKSGRLVPEYRPAASPTFVLTKHSNSHRKVLELRRQKELLRAQQQQQFLHHHHHQNMMFDVSNGDDYLIHQHIGPDFRQLI